SSDILGTEDIPVRASRPALTFANERPNPKAVRREVSLTSLQVPDIVSRHENRRVRHAWLPPEAVLSLLRQRYPRRQVLETIAARFEQGQRSRRAAATARSGRHEQYERLVRIDQDHFGIEHVLLRRLEADLRSRTAHLRRRDGRQ